MTRLVRFSNNAVSQLAANLTISGTSLSVLPGEGSKFPTISGSQYFMATLVKADGSTEVVKVTARSTDTMTIVRAAEPVAGASTAYAFSAGDRIEARLTAGVLGGEIDRLDNGSIFETLNKSANYTVVEADVTTLIRVNTASGNVTISLPQISALTDDFDILVAKVTSDVNSVIIQRSGSTDLINGATSVTLLNQYQSAWVVADRSTGTWTVIGGGLNAVNTVVDSGTGDGTTPTVTLIGDPGSKNNVLFVVGGVYQQKATYSISGTTLTPGATIPNGVKWEAVWSAPLTVGTPSDNTVGTSKLIDGAVTAIKLAVGAVVAHLGFTPLNKAGDTLTGALNEAQGADIASASTINLTTATGNYVNVTGTTAITGITLGQGAERTAKFAGALVLTNGASLILPSGTNITTAAGDVAKFRGEAAGVVRCVNYMKASGQSVASSVVPVDVQTLNSTGTWTKPTGGQLMCRVQIWGGGGGGGNSGGLGGGGGGGGYNEWTGPIADIASQTITIGGGGAGTGTNNTRGATGGTTSCSIGGKTITATGGVGGLAGNNSGGAGAGGGPQGILDQFGGHFRGGTGGQCIDCGGAQVVAGLSSVYGGGGGGGGTGGTAGISAYGGNATANAAGTAPGGGGSSSLAGASGRAVITCW